MPGSYYCFNCMCIGVEATLGHPGQPVTFCLGQVCLAWFIKYLNLTWILHWIKIMASGPDQINELNVLDSDDGNVSTDSP